MAAKKSKKKAPAKRAGKAARPNDIVKLILEDHKPLKRLLKVLKNSDRDLNERKKAFDEFSHLLVAHAKPEEKSLYVYMKKDEDLIEEGYEGDVEHQLADQMVEEAKRADSDHLWSARVKVLAELVEHHIKEEEEEMLPDFKKNSTLEERALLGERFLDYKTQIEAEGSDDAPPEKLVQAQVHA